MSQAYELLNSLNEEEVSAYAAEPAKSDHIVIGSDRFITVPEHLKRIAVQFDHDVETVTFDCPRYWDGRDLYEMQIYINYRTPAGVLDAHLAENKTIDSRNSNIMHFDWTIKSTITKVKGVISFLVCAKKTNEDEEEINHWNSELNQEMFVSEGLECLPRVEQLNSDIITQLLTRMDVVEAVKGDAIAAANEAAGYSQAAGVQASAAADHADRAEASLNAAREVANGVVDVEARGKANQKDIVNFEKDLMFTETDASSAHVKNVPDNALPYAEVTRIGGGRTWKCTNLIPFPYSSKTKTENGITFTVNDDGSIKVNGTATANTLFYFANYSISLAKGSYAISGVPANGSHSSFMIQMADKSGSFAANNTSVNGDAFTLDADTTEIVVLLAVFSGYTANNLTFKPMLNEGSEALPYEPYFEGIKTAKVSGFKSVGVNLIPFPYVAGATKTDNGITFTVNSDGGITVSGTNTHTTYVEYALITTNSKVWEHSAVTASLFGATSDDIYITVGGGGFGFGEVKAGGSTTLTNNGTTNVFSYGLLRVKAGATVSATVYPMLNEGSEALPYEPYVEHCLDISTDLVERDDYCLTLPGTDLENVVEWKPGYGVKRMVKKVGAIDMGTLEWTLSSSGAGYTYFASLIDGKLPTTTAERVTGFICDRYGPSSVTDNTQLDNASMIRHNKGSINVRDDAYTNAADFKAAMSGVMLYYELAAPEIVDLSGFLTDDNKLCVEDAVTVTVENEDGLDIPTTIEYPLSMELGEKVLHDHEHVSINNKRLVNLEKALMTETKDSAVGYSKVVPANALPYARITKVGGMTRKCTNLFGGEAFADKLVSVANGTKDEEAGTVYVLGSSMSSKVIYEGCFKENTPYTIILKCHSTANGYVSITVQYTDGTSEHITGLTANTVETVVHVTNANKTVASLSGANRTNDTFYYRECGIFEGVVTVEDFEPYYEGLRNAKVTEIESVGVNIFGGEALADKFVALSKATKDEVAGTVAFTAQNASGAVYFSDFKPNTVYTFILYGKTTGEAYANLNIAYTDGTVERIAFTAVDTEGYYVYATASGKTVYRFSGTYMIGTTTLYYDKCGIFEGVLTADDFKPYVRNTLPIPEAVQALDGYGDSVYSYIDWEKKQFVKSVKTLIVKGTEGKWTEATTPNKYSLDAPYDCMVGLSVRNDVPYVCSHYNAVHYNDRADKTMYMYTTGDRNVIQFYDTDFATLADFKAHLAELYASGNPIKIAYPLATPEVTDISDILPDDNMIAVEGGGIVTAVNEYEYDVPTTVVYSTSK